MHSIHWQSLITNFIGNSFVYAVVSYAMKSFPMPTSQYGKWALGVIQYALTNSELAKQNFEAATNGTIDSGTAAKAAKV